MPNAALKSGETGAREVSKRIVLGGATGAALALAAASNECVDGMVGHTQDNATWIYVAASTATDATGQLVQQPYDLPAAGRWLRIDRAFDLKVAVTFATADAAVLFTVPVGFKMRVTRAFWEVTVGWTGGASSAIGMSSSNAAYNTRGDIEGGAGGDLAALLITASPGPYVGAAGTKVGGTVPVILVAGDVLRFDRIVSAFTAGAAAAHVCCELVS